MDIILVSNRSAKVYTLRLSRSRLALLSILALILFLVGIIAAQYLIVRLQPSSLSNGMRDWLAGSQVDDQQKQDSYLREGMNTMAMRLGQMQAQLLRLDNLGARLAKLSGLKPEELTFDQVPGQGGPYIPNNNKEIPHDNNFTGPNGTFGINHGSTKNDASWINLNQQLGTLSALLNDRNDKLVALETLLLQTQFNNKQILSVRPINNGWSSSNFGWRIDPFTGMNAMHEGVDYVVPEGTAIRAAASGMVVYSGAHPQYGNMIEIDHGTEIVTRYAHASKLLAQVGQVVRRGQEIAQVGSTGRSTGTHLHFEVRYKGIAQNPIRFLKDAQC